MLAGVYAIPLVVFFPTFILLFGTGPNSKIALGAVYAFFPIALNTIVGFGQVDRRLIAAARSMGASDTQLLRRVLLPAALPFVATGMRIAFIACFASVLAGEMLASVHGLGYEIAQSGAMMNLATMFGYVTLVVLTAFVFNFSLGAFEARQRRAYRAFDRGARAAATSARAAWAGRPLGTARARHWRCSPCRPGQCRRDAARLAGRGGGDRPAIPQPAAGSLRGDSGPLRRPQDRARAGHQLRRTRDRLQPSRSSRGVAIAIPVGLNTLGYKTVFPIMLLLYAIPQVTILPLFILYFGLGPPAKIAFGASHGIFPIMLNVVAGIRGVRPIFLSAARAMGATPPQIVRRVIMPYALAGLFTGMRLAMSITLLGVMLAELYVSTSGIGYYTTLFSNEFNATNLLALITVLALMAIFLNESRAATRAPLQPLAADRTLMRGRHGPTS